MCEINLEPALDPLHGRIEIPEFHLREFFADQIHHLFDTHELSGVGDADPAQVPVGIDIEITPLDHGEVRLADEAAQGLVFFYAVRHARESKIVDGSPAAKAAHYLQAFHDVF